MDTCHKAMKMNPQLASTGRCSKNRSIIHVFPRPTRPTCKDLTRCDGLLRKPFRPVRGLRWFCSGLLELVQAPATRPGCRGRLINFAIGRPVPCNGAASDGVRHRAGIYGLRTVGRAVDRFGELVAKRHFSTGRAGPSGDDGKNGRLRCMTISPACGFNVLHPLRTASKLTTSSSSPWIISQGHSGRGRLSEAEADYGRRDATPAGPVSGSGPPAR